MRVLPCNRKIVEVFLAVQTQWARAGQAALPTGLDYARVQAAMEMMAIKRKRRPRLFAGLRIMEAAALPELQRQVRNQLDKARPGRGRRR